MRPARLSEEMVLEAFRCGAPVVLVSGCHFADCHYINAVTWTQKRIERIWNKMEKLGLRPERLQLEWISAAEGPKFQHTMNQMEELRKTVTDEEVRHTMEVLEKEHEKELAKLARRAAKSAGNDARAMAVKGVASPVKGESAHESAHGIPATANGAARKPASANRASASLTSGRIINRFPSNDGSQASAAAAWGANCSLASLAAASRAASKVVRSWPANEDDAHRPSTFSISYNRNSMSRALSRSAMIGLRQRALSGRPGGG